MVVSLQPTISRHKFVKIEHLERSMKVELRMHIDPWNRLVFKCEEKTFMTK
jgi:hypothetical protein